MRVGSLQVLLAGVLSPTGQLIARSLSEDGTYQVRALCSPDIGRAIQDNNGPLTETKVGPSGTAVLADVLVIATDDPPPVEDTCALLNMCKGVSHTVLVSRIGGATGARGLGGWKAVEDAAVKVCPDLTIVRFGEPLLGGPYYATDIDTIRWKTAKVADLQLVADVAKGDESISQGGFGGSRLVAASAVASVLRRGPEAQSSYSVASVSCDGKDLTATTAEEFDAKFAKAAGSAAAQDGEDEPTKPAEVLLDFAQLTAFTQPPEPTRLSPIELLKANLFGNPAVAGPNWFFLIFLVGGLYQCTTPEYIARTGQDVFGLAPQYGITLDAAARAATYGM